MLLCCCKSRHCILRPDLTPQAADVVKARLQPPADRSAATEDERHPLLPSQMQRRSPSTKQLLLFVCSSRRKKVSVIWPPPFSVGSLCRRATSRSRSDRKYKTSLPATVKCTPSRGFRVIITINIYNQYFDGAWLCSFSHFVLMAVDTVVFMATIYLAVAHKSHLNASL